MKLADLYSEYFANWVSGGLLINEDKISLLGIKPLFDRFLTNGYSTKAWMVTGLPVNFNINLMQAIRQEMFAIYPNVSLIIHTYSEPVNINVNSDVFRRQLKSSAKRYNMYKSVFDQLSEDEQLTGAYEANPVSGRRIGIDSETLAKIKDDYDSYAYVYEQVMSGTTFTNTYFFIQATCNDRKIMHKFSKALSDKLTSNKIYFQEIHGNVGQYLLNFCPASFRQTAHNKFTSLLLSEDNLAAILPNKTKGLIEDSGLMFAMDYQSKDPFFIDFFNSGAAQVIMLLAQSGFGKTYMAFAIAIALSSMDVHWSATDIKGNEWSVLAKYVKIIEISMSGSNARFVNTMRLDDVACDYSDCEEFFETAVQGTCDLFEIATNLMPSEGNVADLRAILSTAIIKVYESAGVVKNNPATFAITKNFRYADVLDVLSSLALSSSYTDKQREICSLIQTRTSQYFMSEGRYNNAFTNELTIGEILESAGVVYNFNKNSTEQLDTLDSLRVFMSQFADGKKHSIRRRTGLHTAAFYEELQRCDGVGTLLKSISSKVTGSRSNNLTVFLLLNAVSTFKNADFSAIKSNITTKIIGKVIDDDLKYLVNEFDCKMMKDYLELINDPITSYEYRNCFAVQYDTGVSSGKAVIKAAVPESWSTQLRTRTFMNESEV